MTEQYTSVRLDVPNMYRLTETQSLMAQSKVLQWNMKQYPLLDRDLTTLISPLIRWRSNLTWDHANSKCGYSVKARSK